MEKLNCPSKPKTASKITEICHSRTEKIMRLAQGISSSDNTIEEQCFRETKSIHSMFNENNLNDVSSSSHVSLEITDSTLVEYQPFPLMLEDPISPDFLGCTRFQNIDGWKPAESIENAISETNDYYYEQPNVVGPFSVAPEELEFINNDFVAVETAAHIIPDNQSVNEEIHRPFEILDVGIENQASVHESEKPVIVEQKAVTSVNYSETDAKNVRDSQEILVEKEVDSRCNGSDAMVYKQVCSEKRTLKRREQQRENGSDNVKEKCKYSKKRRLEKYKKRNAGQSYTTLEGKQIRGRELKALPICRAKCKDRFSEEVRENIFTEYWGLGSRDKRVAYVASLVQSIKPKTQRKRTHDIEKEKFRMLTHKFNFKVNGVLIPVCRGCFSKTLDETNMFITLAINNSLSNSVSGIIDSDNRGRHPPANTKNEQQIDEVKKHILSFPAYESHYTRRRNDKKYLPSFLNMGKMYALYKECVSSPVSRTIYEREFHKMKLCFKSPKVDTCHKYDTLAMKKKVAETDDEQLMITNEIKKHHEEADKAYVSKDVDKKMSKSDDSKLCYTFDLQQCLPTPFVNSSVSFYKRQLWTYNLTMHEASGKVRCYMWHEAEGGRGANQIATCIYKELICVPDKIKQITLYSDTCGGQNRNSHVSAMFLTLMQNKSHLLQVDHKFMVSGHSHLECDVDHALIEKQKKRLDIPISHPYDWYQLVRSVGKRNKFEVVELGHLDFLNFADLYKTSLSLKKRDTEGSPFKWTDIKWLRYTQERAIVYFKCTLDENEPFRSFSLQKRNSKSENVLLPVACYSSVLPVSTEKKKDLLDLLPLISPAFHDFYINLKTSGNVKLSLPDIEEFPED